MSCLCIKDQFGDVHATRISRANPEDVEREARALAVSLGIFETVKVGLCSKRDPGAARIAQGDYANGGIEWLYDLRIEGDE